MGETNVAKDPPNLFSSSFILSHGLSLFTLTFVSAHLRFRLFFMKAY